MLPQYSQIAEKQLGTNINKIVKHIDQERKVNNADEIKEKQKRTIIVKHYTSKNIRNSEDVRNPIYDKFPGTVIRDARTTPGGSILLELDDEKTAANIFENWDENLYGGNKGAMRGNIPNTIGIVKHVLKPDDENELKQEILQNYPCKEVDLFKKNGEFMGIVKITFNTAEDLQNAKVERIKIFRQRLIIDDYNFKPRVIKCNKCQLMGHIARLCRRSEVCGKCGNNHNTNACTIEPKDYVCYHCKGNHATGDKNCPVMKNKEESISNRRQNE